MLLRQLFDSETSTYTYLLADATTRAAVLIDPVLSKVERDLSLIDELDLTLEMTLETHVHADHVTGGAVMRVRRGSLYGVARAGGTIGEDRALEDGETIEFGQQRLRVLATPGHTDGCLSFYSEGTGHVFTGDTLLIRGCGRTDFQQGDASTLFRSIHQKLFVLPSSVIIMPGHDYRGLQRSTVEEERRLNARLGGETTEAEFVECMNNLGLPRPKLIDEAVPRNLRCGLDDGGWAPLARTAEGQAELSAETLMTLDQDVRIIDVRQLDQQNDALSPLPRAEAIPLADLTRAARRWSRTSPLVVVSQRGARSGLAARQLEGLGFTQVASLGGGLRRWHDLRNRHAA